MVRAVDGQGERVMNDYPGYIAVEGPMGSGTTTLALKIAERLGHQTILDQFAANPYLERFYRDPEQFALATQLSFLRTRLEQQKELVGMLGDNVISDYLLARDELYAGIALTEEELDLYQYYFGHLHPSPPKPDLVVYLQATPEALMNRIDRRGRGFEVDVQIAYLRRLIEAYNSFFFHYNETPLLVINTTEIDYVHSEIELDYLLEEINRTRTGTRYYVVSNVQE
jgi:deoxyguanosine kinase